MITRSPAWTPGLVVAGALAFGSVASGCGGSDGTGPAPSAELASISVSVSPNSVEVGQSAVASARGVASDGSTLSLGTISWSVAPAGVAEVSASGTLTGLAPGQAVVTASAQGKSGTATVQITAPAAAAIVLSAAALNLTVGETAQVVAEVRGASGQLLAAKTVAWSTSNTSVVGGFANGNLATLEAVGAGSAVVSAEVDGVVANLAVTVAAQAAQSVATVLLTPSTIRLAVGDVVPVVATLLDANSNVLTGRVVSWSTDNLSVIDGQVSENVLLLQALAPGSALLFAESEGVTATAFVTVLPAGGSVIPLTCSGVAGGVVYAVNGQFLGRLNNRFHPESILNEFGRYGSPFSATSMYNEFSQYGSEFSHLSAYNPFTSTPPQLYVSGEFVAFVTRNEFKVPRMDPNLLRTCAFP